MRHADLCDALDAAADVLKCRDFVAADRIRTEVYASGLPLSWFAGEQIGLMMAEARTVRPTVEDLRKVAA